MDPRLFSITDNFALATAQMAVLGKFQCPYCLKTLSSKQNFKEHSYIHTGEKPFKCREPGCNESFRQGSQLSVHRKMHRQVVLLQTRAQFQIPKVTFIQLTDLLKAQVTSKTPTFPPKTHEKCHLPDISLKTEEPAKDVKLPSELFFMD